MARTRLRPIGAPGDLVTGVKLAGDHARQTHGHGLPKGGLVESVAPESPGAAVGIAAGDVILRINERRLRDVVDYQFYAAEAVLDLEVAPASDLSERRVVHVVKDAAESLGLTFAQPTFAPIRECNNHCPFCFIDQLPDTMRSSLYIRDDDYRYSFMFGNFVTLTNLNERDWSRLAEQRLSPLYVSVHATDPAMRRLLLGNDRAPDIRDQLDRLFDMGIRVHTQVVVCPGLNDGAVLADTIQDLTARYPHVLSIGVVPVGLTRTPAEILAGPGASCSRILPSAADLPLRTFDPEEARSVIDQVQSWQRQFRQRYDQSVVYASDEFYLLARVPVPSARWYDGYPQYENGIGMVRDLLDDWSRTRARLQRRGDSRRPAVQRVTLICGEMIAPTLARLVAEWEALTGAHAQLIAIPNAFFGPRVRVSGLLTGRDVIAHARRFTGDVVVLPEVMLDKTGTRLLDNLTPDDMSARLGRPVHFAGMLSQVDRLVRALASAA